MLFDDSINKNLFSPCEIQKMMIDDNNDKNVFVNICSKSFSRRTSLAAHRLLHTGRVTKSDQNTDKSP